MVIDTTFEQTKELKVLKVYISSGRMKVLFSVSLIPVVLRRKHEIYGEYCLELTPYIFINPVAEYAGMLTKFLKVITCITNVTDGR